MRKTLSLFLWLAAVTAHAQIGFFGGGASTPPPPPPGVPGQVTNLTSVAGDRFVDYAWDEIEFALTYLVEWDMDATGEPYTNSLVVAQASVRLSDLTNGVTVYARVTAQNNQGNGTASTEDEETPEAEDPFIAFINTGGLAHSGTVEFVADVGFSNRTGTHSTGSTIANAIDQVPARTHSFGSGLTYTFADISNTTYIVKSGHSENWFTTTTSRVFSWVLESGEGDETAHITALDLVDEVGAKTEYIAVSDVTVADNQLDFVGSSSADLPQINWLKIYPIGASNPDQVTGLTLTVLGDDSIMVAWNDTMTAKSYTVEWDVDSGVSYANSQSGILTAHYTIGSLSSGTEYFITVYGVNQNGNGTRATEDSATTESGTPGNLIRLFVEPGGNDGNDGSDNSSNALATLEGARDRLRALTGRTSDGTTSITLQSPYDGGSWEGAEIIVGGGVYDHSASAITFDERDSGTSGARITYVAAQGETVILTGAYQVDDGDWALASVAGGTPYGRLPDAVDQNVYRLNVGALGINTGDTNMRNGMDDFLMLLDDGALQTMSRYPNGAGDDPVAWDMSPQATNTGWFRAESWVDGPDTVRVDSSWFSSLPDEADVTLTGFNPSGQSGALHGVMRTPYWANWGPISALSTSSGDVIITTSIHNLGESMTPFFAVRNMLEGLDAGGEYVWYQPGGLLYYLTNQANAPTNTSLTLGANIITLGVDNQSSQAVNYVTFQNLTLEGSRVNAFRQYFGTGNTLDGVEIRSCSGAYGAAWIEDATGTTITNCNIHDMAGGGIVIHGGDKDTLTLAGHVISNTQFVDIARETYFRQSAILTNNTNGTVPGDAAGITIDGNTFRYVRQTAVTVDAFGVTMSNNLFDRVVSFSGDMGAIMTEYRYTNRDMVISGNTFQNIFRNGDISGTSNDLFTPAGGAIFPIYLDLAGDVLIEDNVWLNTDQGMNLAAIKDTVVRRNKFTNAKLGHFNAPIVFGARSAHSGTPLAVALEDLEEWALTVSPWTTEWPNGQHYRNGGSRRPALLYPENVTIVDNMVTSGAAYLVDFQGSAGDQWEKTVSGIAVGIATDQLNYAIGATGTPTEDGGAVELINILHSDSTAP